MAKIHHAYRKLTHRYKACHSHLDEEAYQGFSFKEVSGRNVYWDLNRDGEVEYDAGYTRYLWLTASRPVSRKELADSLHVYSRDCACEHDCCGHYFGGAQTHRLRPVGRLRDGKTRHWIVPVHYAPNL